MPAEADRIRSCRTNSESFRVVILHLEYPHRRDRSDLSDETKRGRAFYSGQFYNVVG